MGPINLQVRYRPVRIGWCVKEGDLAEYRQALRLSHVFWGGKFNPIIPLGDPELARLLVKSYRVDCLYCISSSPEGESLLKEFAHLMWPSFHKELFIEGHRGRVPIFLDISHPARHFHDDNVRDRENPARRGTIVQWETSDPSADVFLATFGGYPSPTEIGRDYEKFFTKLLASQEVKIGEAGNIPEDLYKALTPSALSSVDLQPSTYEWGRDDPGIYYGEVGNFRDLVNFWNLRAGGIQVLFYDPVHHARFIGMANNFLGLLRARPADPTGWRNHVAIWKQSHDPMADPPVDFAAFGQGLLLASISNYLWNGLNLKPALMGFEERSVLGVVSGEGRNAVTFELPPKPFFEDIEDHTQEMVVSVHPLVTNENVILKPPFLPALNEYYGREAYFEYNAVRSEPTGLGIITGIRTSNLTIRALDVRTLVKKIFEVCGIAAKPSPAGLIGLRLIEQMGGLQGCRVFKIKGVRELIREYPPDSSFTRSGAIQMIRQLDPETQKVQFDEYKNLYMDGKPAKPEVAFANLLKQGVFRAGLRFVCPNCELEGWVHLDDARTVSRCEYCGNDFNITSQLKDRDWAFRRSGLFGRNDHQGGGIPVALTLQQLQTTLHMSILGYTAGTELEPLTANIQKCETDFVLISESLREKALQITIGECKSRDEITEEDVRKLGLVADALQATDLCEVFIVFAKTHHFTVEEVERCKRAQGKYGVRVILLSRRELEPYHVYELTEQEFEIRHSAISLEDMAQATQNIYFDPKPKIKTVEQVPPG